MRDSSRCILLEFTLCQVCFNRCIKEINQYWRIKAESMDLSKLLPGQIWSKIILTYNLSHWAETHFDQPCSPVRGSGRVCPGSGGSCSRMPNAGAGDTQHSYLAVETTSSLSIRWPSSQVLTLTGGAKIIAWCVWGASF